MSKIFYAKEIPVKTNNIDGIEPHLSNIYLHIRAGQWAGKVENYWWIVPLDYRNATEMK
jgi:hypothetical protein